MILHPLKGRPFGGRSFIVNKRILIIRHEFINRYRYDDGNKISIVACYLPFDNGTQLNLSEFNSCLQIAVELLKIFLKTAIKQLSLLVI
jgi:hypothetical protein